MGHISQKKLMSRKFPTIGATFGKKLGIKGIDEQNS